MTERAYARKRAGLSSAAGAGLRILLALTLRLRQAPAHLDVRPSDFATLSHARPRLA